jgi:cell wall-associated NlpC family hydrolase
VSARFAACAVVSQPVLDLRRRPDHASEMVSQLLLGEVVDVRGSGGAGRWFRVRNRADGYGGWARAWGLVPASPARASRWLARARHTVIEPTAWLRADHDDSAIAPLPWQARVIAGNARRGRVHAELPDGRRGWLAASALAAAGTPAMGLFERIRSLIGVPYLWGGRSAFALDCSGFTQLTLAEQGVRLPRDAHEQYLACREIGAQDHARFGDLVFFGQSGRRQAHVGLYLGSGLFVHARGQVSINSLDPDNVLCDLALADQYRGIGRPARGWRPASGKIALTRFRQLS